MTITVHLPSATVEELEARAAVTGKDLGTLVAENGDLAAAIEQVLAAPPPDRQPLTAAVRARFGRDVFAARVAAVLHRLLPAAPVLA